MPSRSTPCIMPSDLSAPEMYLASRCSSSPIRLRWPSWLSLTMTSDAPPANAPSMAAFTSRTIRSRTRSYSPWLDGLPAAVSSGASTWIHDDTPQVPSISAEIRIFTQMPPRQLFRMLHGYHRTREGENTKRAGPGESPDACPFGGCISVRRSPARIDPDDYLAWLRRRRRSALRRLARSSSWTLMKRSPRRCSRRMPERSIPLLKRRRSCSKPSLSRISTRINAYHHLQARVVAECQGRRGTLEAHHERRTHLRPVAL